MMSKLSPAQQRAYDAMTPGVWYSAYDLKVSSATLNVLYTRGCVNRRAFLGYMWCPRTAVQYLRPATPRVELHEAAN